MAGMDRLPAQRFGNSILGMTVRGLLSETAKTLPYFSSAVTF